MVDNGYEVVMILGDMKNNTIITLLSSVGVASAAAVFEPVITIESLNNTFNIHEYEIRGNYDFNISESQYFEASEQYDYTSVYYQVDLLTDQDVYMVAISYKQDGTYAADISNSLQGNAYSWQTYTLSESQWDSSVEFTLGVSNVDVPTVSYDLITQFENDMPMGANMMTSTVVDTSELGSFDSLFGTEDDMVAVYVLGNRQYRLDYTSAGILDDESMTSVTPSSPLNESNDIDSINWSESDTDFTFSRSNADLASNAIIVGLNGAIIGTSVPEPSTSILASLSAFALIARRRR